MKRTLLFTALGLALLLFAAPGAFAFGTKDVVKMTQEGIDDDVIITKIENSETVFILDRKDIEHLRDDGVSEEVIEAMLKTEKYAEDDDYYVPQRGYAYYPYRSYVYDPFWYPSSGFSFGLGFGHYGHNYYRSGRYYYPPRYSPGTGSSSGTTTRERTTYNARPGWPGSGQTGTTSGRTTTGRSSSGGWGTRTRTR